jgi:hypothetical protein
LTDGIDILRIVPVGPADTLSVIHQLYFFLTQQGEVDKQKDFARITNSSMATGCSFKE